MVGLVNKHQKSRKNIFAITLLIVLITLGVLTIILVLNLKKEGNKTTTKIKAETKTYEKVVRLPVKETNNIIVTINPSITDTIQKKDIITPIISPSSPVFVALNENQQVDDYYSSDSGSEITTTIAPTIKVTIPTNETLPKSGLMLPSFLLVAASIGLIFISLAL
ncbi:hypothetical protein A3C23_03100 [Candidatus Roizmanbacteria bacterium RIFCSPHIGHO2_02_FULL_37_13b]|uniref:Uncharacterized protein n=1 Tax=Candidatus Roizmanbacteria bacterium RIFCSPLOWO2_02_FULL_36_11 TaxID=1802071 RepID=A0A1F7JIA4_9BACT|nr:MAG: hypothetical protein A3C23_03100 [Candidatus Roizmanbacteria bacterium RIFCSPHIGHO2_02_FULL_37_13b]OGK55338.1 MAG: hypothetical protein A3H78_04535 [Candidatus Roizmanbacteria bacterium RIFCSPLOWO2_02_FULL_36_11]